MEPIEINAGTYYLRALRADDLIDDRPALRAVTADPDAHLAARARGWAEDTDYVWAIAEPTTGALMGEVGLTGLDREPGSAEAICWITKAHQGKGIATAALGSVLRFGAGALDLTEIHADDPTLARLAAKLGLPHRPV